MIGKIFTSKGILTIDMPEGRTGEQAMVCPICSSSRKPEHKNEKKFSINMSKPDQPWRCNHCNESGYLLSDERIRQMKVKPLDHIPETGNVSPGVIGWFKDRCITEPTLEHFRISMNNETIIVNKTTNDDIRGKFVSRKCINFPYFWNNSLINVKFRDPEKNFKLISGASLILYNIDSIRNQNYAIITEGEIDCMSYHEAGLQSVVSVPNGAQISAKEKEHFERTGQILFEKQMNLEYLDNCIAEFENIDTIYLATDDDPPGIKLREELARRLGKRRCKYIRFSQWKDKEGNSIKDANQLLMIYGKNELKESLKKADEYPVEGVIKISEMWNEISDEYDNGIKKGISTGYLSLDPHFNWMPGWLCVVNGFPTEGKSTLWFNFIVLSTILYGWKWGLYCPENYPPRNIFYIMAEILLGQTLYEGSNNRASKSKVEKVMEYLSNFIYFLDNDKGFTPEQLRDKTGEMIAKYGIKGFYLDPWRNLKHNKGNRTIDEYLESQLAEEIRLATHTDTIRVITHHPPTPIRNAEKKYPVPSPFELVGGTIWYGMAYQMICISREDKEDMYNNFVHVHVQKVKDHKRGGIWTVRDNPVKLNFKRSCSRFLEIDKPGKLSSDPSDYTRFPIKNQFQNEQLIIDEF